MQKSKLHWKETYILCFYIFLNDTKSVCFYTIFTMHMKYLICCILMINVFIVHHHILLSPAWFIGSISLLLIWLCFKHLIWQQRHRLGKTSLSKHRCSISCLAEILNNKASISHLMWHQNEFCVLKSKLETKL